VLLPWRGWVKKRSGFKGPKNGVLQRIRPRLLSCAYSARRTLRGEDGQATLEYLLVLAGVTSMLAALYALARAGEGGVLANLASRCVSHAVGGASLREGLLDIFMY